MATLRNGRISKLWAVTAFLVLSVIAPPLAAQEKPAPQALAVSNAAGPAAADKAQEPPNSVAPQDQVLKEKSVFFPDLASNRTPLTVNEKFLLFAKDSVSPAALLGSAFGAGIAQATDTPSGYGQGAEGYGKRFGAALATGASRNFFGGFILASIAHQDPRYFVHGEGTFGQRFGHAVSRVVVAPNDRGGYGFNWGGVFGPLGAQALANSYLPVREQTGARTMSRYGVDLAGAAAVNVLKEFWPDIFKHLGAKK